MPSHRSALDRSAVAVVIPVKAFHHAKERLGELLTTTERVDLAKYCANRVVKAASTFEIIVVCDDPDVAQWARDHDAQVVGQPEIGLNAAVHRGVNFASTLNKQLVIITHSDLPLATQFEHLIDGQNAETLLTSITLVPDRHQQGTNVMVLPTKCDFKFCYGQDSFTAHQRMAHSCGLSVRVVHDPRLAIDIDTVDDLAMAHQIERSFDTK